MDQMWSHPLATDNPKQIATMISSQKTAQQKLVKAEDEQKDIKDVDLEVKSRGDK